MTQMAQPFLDADELLHLALEASRMGRTEEAIVTLKRALEIAPNDARAHYVLGSLYTQIRMMDRAVKHLQNAIVFDPTLESAHFQLGWIYWNAGQADAAADAWKVFDKLGKEHPLYLFKTGLMHLSKNEFAECEKFLRQGLAINTTHVQLNQDMAMLLKQVIDHMTALKAATPETPAAAAPKAVKTEAAPTAAKPATPSATKSATPAARRLDAYQQDGRPDKED
jgi:tetratricopeptide (TPR) repeat protein